MIPTTTQKLTTAASMIQSPRTMTTTLETFSNAITRVRNILRTVGVTGMDSLRHTCLYLLSRYTTIARASTMGIPAKFAWENLLTTVRTVEGGKQFALDAFNHRDNDCLVNHFDRLFGTTEFPFTLTNPDRHKEILEILELIHLEDLECKTDILGWVYEQHLHTGASGGGGRDLGQFFTDRLICKYMVELCQPKFKAPGVPESVCDPSTGTAGFLTMWIKYFRTQYPDTSVDWKVQQQEVYGCDIDAKVAGIARLNLFMESGGHLFENIKYRDSLYSDISESVSGVDVILANMPFGVKGLKHADCCPRVKALKLNGTKSEPLFLQLMMAALNMGGRCAVVVPDGMLVNSSKCHDGTRKHLLDNFELRRVIKMKGQYFMNTGIQPSILFFERTGSPTAAVEFWDVITDADGTVHPTHILTVPREKIDASCSLDMRRYQETTRPVASPIGFPIVKLGDILTDYPVKKPVATTTADGGCFSLFSSSCDVFKHSVAEFSGKPYLLQGSRGTISKATHYCDTPFSASNNVFVLTATDPSNVSLKYVYYFLRLSSIADKTATTSVIPMLTKTMFREIALPLPPLSIQEELVATFDRIYTPGTTELADTLKMAEGQQLIHRSTQLVADVKTQMLADVKTQMVAIMKSVSNRGFPLVKLKDVADCRNGKNIPQGNRSTSGTYPYYASNGVSGYVEQTNFQGPATLLGDQGSCWTKSSHYVQEGVQFYAGNHTIVMKSNTDSLYIKFLHYFVSLSDLSDFNRSSALIPELDKQRFFELELPLPPLDFQMDVLTRLDALHSQHAALESLQRQSEDNARFILDSYLG